MALDPDVLAELRGWVGSTPDDSDLEDRYTRLTTVAAVALEVLRGRLADVLANPAQFSIDGDYSENRSENIRALRSQIAELEVLAAAALDGGGTLTSGQLIRCHEGR